MPFTYVGNAATPNATSNSSNTSVKAIASLITFPDLSGVGIPAAPGKTGVAARPALTSDMVLYLSGTGTRQASLGLWGSTGNLVSQSSTFTLTSSATPVSVNRSITPKILYGNTKYYVGFRKQSTGTFYWSGTSQPKIDVSYTEDDLRFLNKGGIGFTGVLHWQIGIDVLPSAPLSPVATVTGGTEVDITLTWDAVASDGGQPVEGYRIQRSTNGTTWTTRVENSKSTTRSYVERNLTPGIRYYYRVAAINEVALEAGSSYSGPYSATVSALIPGVEPGNALSVVTVTVANPEPTPLIFSDFGPGIRFTEIAVQYGSEYLYNEVQAITQDAFAELQTASAPESKQLYGIRTYSVNSLLNATDSGAFDVAKDLLTYYYRPELRVESVTVDLSNLTIDEKLQVLALEIDDYISISFTPNGIGDPKIQSGLVTGIAHRISITSHQVELRLRNERNLFTLDSDSKGILDVNILGP